MCVCVCIHDHVSAAILAQVGRVDLHLRKRTPYSHIDRITSSLIYRAMTTRKARILARLYEGTAGSVGLVENPNQSAGVTKCKKRAGDDKDDAKSKRLKTALDNQILYREYYFERAELRRRLISENRPALAIIWDRYNF